MRGPTHNHGHTLELVFSHGLPLNNLEINDTGFSDHKSVIFTTSFPHTSSEAPVLARLPRYFSPTASKDFAAAYTAVKSSLDEFRTSEYNADEYLNHFSNTCLNIVNNIAPLKCKRSKEESAPWFNDYIRSLRRVCRRAERKFRKDRLQMSYEMLKESLSVFPEGC